MRCSALVLVSFLLSVPALHAGDDPAFPASWEGVWKGPCVVVRDGAEKLRFPMELRVAPLDGRAGWTWTIVYDKQVRPYELLPVAGEPFRFVVDEKNGILLDSFFENDRLHARFRVGASVVDATYARSGDSMVVTLTTFAATPLRTARGVETFALKAVQRGTLTRG